MVIQTNEHEFRGKILQEYLEWKYPTKEDKEGVKRIDVYDINKARRRAGITKKAKNRKDKEVDVVIKLEGGELDLKEFKNVEETNIVGRSLNSRLTKLNISGCHELKILDCSGNQLTSIDLNNCDS